MNTIHGHTVLHAFVNPNYGWGNGPTLYIALLEPFKQGDIVYNKTDSCYWYQGEDGYTSFLFHGGDVTPTDEVRDGLKVFKTPQHRGYSGHVFPLKVNLNGEIVLVDVAGPGSGGCYLANGILPKHATEVTYIGGHGGYTGGYLALDAVNSLLAHCDPEWRFTTIRDMGSEYSPCALLRGVGRKPMRQDEQDASSPRWKAIQERATLLLKQCDKEAKERWRNSDECKAIQEHNARVFAEHDRPRRRR
jgi:hypothetical protein